MKVSLTKPELLVLLSRALNVEVTELVISKEGTLLNRIIEAMKVELKAYDIHVTDTVAFNGVIARPEKKIVCIKALRAAVAKIPQALPKGEICMQLVDSKYAIENWTEYAEFVKTKRRLPKIKFGSNRYFME